MNESFSYLTVYTTSFRNSNSYIYIRPWKSSVIVYLSLPHSSKIHLLSEHRLNSPSCRIMSTVNKCPVSKASKNHWKKTVVMFWLFFMWFCILTRNFSSIDLRLLHLQLIHPIRTAKWIFRINKKPTFNNFIILQIFI